MMDMTYGSLAEAEEIDGHDCRYGIGAVNPSPLSLSIFADRLALRSELQHDALEAGLRIATTADLGALSGDAAQPLGDVILVDCPLIDAAVMAGLARLDVRAARIGAALIVSTSVDALDSVFACLDQSAPQILVGPSRAERLIALGQALSARPAQVRELSEADRMMLVRLAERVQEIGARLERIRTAVDSRIAARDGSTAGGPADRVGDAGLMFRFDTAPRETDRLVALPAPVGLPDPRIVRTVIRQRQQRARFFPADMFADPAWEILLDLTAARGEGVDVSVSSLCIASGAAPTTALRWIALMTEAGLLRRESDTRDRRRAFVALTDQAADAMARYFASLDPDAMPFG